MGNQPSGLVTITCSNCGKKLAEAKIKDGVVSIKCKCGVVNTIDVKKISSDKIANNLR